jgi:metal-sulfur cluster biosynthetic enzyme
MSDSLTSKTLTAESARDHLRAVIDPEIYQNIVDLGLVYRVEVSPEQVVDVTMTLTTPHCPMGPQIIENVERVLRDHGANDVQIHIVWEPMWTPDAMTDELKRELGIIPEEEPEEEEVESAYSAPPPPPPAPKKKGLLGRLFGR